MRTFRDLSLIALCAIGLATPALAQSSSPPMSPLESVCTQYGRQLTAYVAPAAVMGTQEYRAVFFPARDECMSRGGPQFMPNGYANAPHFRPGPVAQPNPPATGGSTPGGSAPGGSSTNPSAPGQPPVVTSPPASPANPPVATSPSAPTGGTSNPPIPQPTPQPTQAQLAANAQRFVPPGLTLPAAVRQAMAECETTGVTAANATAGLSDAQWRNFVFQTELDCAARGGKVNGRTTNSPVMARALTAALTGIPPGSSYVCEVVDDGTRICFTSGGEWYTCLAGGECMRMDEVMWVNEGGLSPGVITIFSCVAGRCLRIPVTEYPRGGAGGPAEDRGLKFRNKYMGACSGGGSTPTEVGLCAFNACMRDNSLNAEYCKAAMLDGTGKSVEEVFLDHLQQIFQNSRDTAQAVQATSQEYAKSAAVEWSKQVVKSNGAKVLDVTGEVAKGMARPIGGKVVAPAVSPWLKAAGMKSPLSVLYEFAFGMTIMFNSIANPCAGSLEGTAYCAGSLEAMAGTGPARTRQPKPFDAAYADHCRDAYGPKNALRQTTLPPAFINYLVPAMVSDCIRSAPDLSQVRQALTSIVSECTDRWIMAQPDVHSMSRVVNGCFWRLGSSSPDPAYPLAGKMGAEAFTRSLQQCSMGFGLDWYGGNGVHAHAMTKRGQPEPNLQAYASHLRACMVAHVNAAIQ